jgi:hypothetical protein
MGEIAEDPSAWNAWQIKVVHTILERDDYLTSLFKVNWDG